MALDEILTEFSVRGINLTLDLLRPWSAAFAERTPDA